MAVRPLMQDVQRHHEVRHNDKVTFTELFFDLIFVFTIIQLSSAMADNYTWIGVLETFVLVLAVWWVWVYTTWVTNWLDPEKGPVRALLFVMMFFGLLLSTSIPAAFDGRGLIFAGAYVTMQVGRSLFTLFALHGRSPTNYRNFLRICVWLSVSGVFWILGAFAAGEARLLLWVLAIGIEYLSPAANFYIPGLGRAAAEDWDVSGPHMAERCALFILICLGETILATGRTFTSTTIDPATVLAFTTAFISTIVMWWVYFRFGRERAARLIETSTRPGELAWSAYTYAHIPIVAGILVTAVGAEFMLDHPLERAGWATISAIVGGPCMHLLGNAWFKALATGHPPLSHLAGAIALLLLLPVTSVLDTLHLGMAATAVLIGVAAWELIAVSSGGAVVD